MTRDAIVVIVNPAAGGGRAGTWRDPVARELAVLAPVQFITPASPEGTSSAACDAERAGARLIVVAGGDGTIHHVINGLTNSPCEIGILPVGTANDLADRLGLPRHPVEAARVIAKGRVRAMDLVVVNGRRLATVGGVGLVADAALAANDLRAGTTMRASLAAGVGPAIYKLAAAWEILRRGDRRWHVTLCLDGSTSVAGALHGVFIANQPTLGGGLRLPSASIPDDGRFEIAAIGAGGRVRLLRALAAIARGRPVAPGVLTTRSTRSARITCDEETSCIGDGEPMGRGRVFDVSIEPARLRVHC